MQEQIDGFLEYLIVEDDASDNTIAAYRNDLSQLETFLTTYRSPLGDTVTGWEQVDTTIIQSYLLELKRRNYAATTVARKVAAIKSFFEHMVEAGIIKDDPTAGMTSPKVKPSCSFVFTPVVDIMGRTILEVGGLQH